MSLHYDLVPTEALSSQPVIGASSTSAETCLSCNPGLYRTRVKRLFDIAVVLAAAPAVLLLVMLLAPMLAMDGGNPFYLQSRVGQHGRFFRMVKLRSMVLDADSRLESYLADNPAARDEWDRKQKLRHDPRITRIGRFLRRSSLDELPQLWNVLRGDMSLVGPRPMMLSQRAIYPGYAYYRLRPGITGSWQVSQRNQSSFADRAAFDVEYDRTLSLATDLKILAATVRVVVRATGY